MTGDDLYFLALLPLIVVCAATAGRELLQSQLPPGRRLAIGLTVTVGVSAACILVGYGRALWVFVFGAAFVILMRLYLRTPALGYEEYLDDGTAVRHSYHHLHLLTLTVLFWSVLTLITQSQLVTKDQRPLLWYATGLAIAVQYCVSAIAKTRRRGWQWASAAKALGMVWFSTMAEVSTEARCHGWAWRRHLVRHPRGLAFLFVMSLLLEFGSPAALLGTFWFTAIGIGLIAFHLGSYFLLGINFWENIYVIAVGIVWSWAWY